MSSLPEIQIPVRLFAILKIIFMVAVFVTIAFNVLTISALPDNTTDWNWGCGPYPEGYYDNEGYPIDNNNNCNYELTDDDLNESDELEDEQQHEEESKEEDED